MISKICKQLENDKTKPKFGILYVCDAARSGIGKDVAMGVQKKLNLNLPFIVPDGRVGFGVRKKRIPIVFDGNKKFVVILPNGQIDKNFAGGNFWQTVNYARSLTGNSAD